MSAAATPQPEPVPNGGSSMHTLACADLERLHPSQTERLVIEDLLERKAFGEAKYGTILQAFNGRDALMDAYQEVLDLVVYLKQHAEEHPTDAHALRAYYEALKLAVFLRRRLEVRGRVDEVGTGGA